jgi:hypothetical protein
LAQPDSVMSRSVSVVRRRFGALWSAAAWPYVAVAICYLTIAFIYRAYHAPSEQVDPSVLYDSMGVFAKIGNLVAFLVSISIPFGLATAGITMIVWADLQGEEVDLWSVFSRIRQVLFRLVVLSLCIVAMCAIAGMFFVCLAFLRSPSWRLPFPCW